MDPSHAARGPCQIGVVDERLPPDRERQRRRDVMGRGDVVGQGHEVRRHHDVERLAGQRDERRDPDRPCDALGHGSSSAPVSQAPWPAGRYRSSRRLAQALGDPFELRLPAIAIGVFWPPDARQGAAKRCLRDLAFDRYADAGTDPASSKQSGQKFTVAVSCRLRAGSTVSRSPGCGLALLLPATGPATATMSWRLNTLFTANCSFNCFVNEVGCSIV